MTWDERWTQDDSILPGTRNGVRGVRRRENGEPGVLKLMLAADHHDNTKRARAAREVIALECLNGDGVPMVLEHNTHLWKDDPSARLYVILEFIPGSPLSHHLSGGPKSLEDSVALVKRLVQIIERIHHAGIRHRDIKPDNVIVRNDDLADPVLIDFGLAWIDQADETSFATGKQEQLGSVWFRLPEFAPGRSGAARGPWSDLTLACGILFHLLSGVAPRQLRDAEDRPPHEVHHDRFRQELLCDARWPWIDAIFDVAFEQIQGLRYQDATGLLDALRRAEGDLANEEQSDRLELAWSRWRRLVKRTELRTLTRISELLRQASENLYATLEVGARERQLPFNRVGRTRADARGWEGCRVPFPPASPPRGRAVRRHDASD